MDKQQRQAYLRANYSKKELRQNWLHYYKWTILAGAFFLLVFIALALSVSGLWNERPDYTAAYVGSCGLTDEMRDAIQTSLASAGEDVNKDGQVLVELREYIVPGDGSADEEMITAQLTSDINSCESFFFILEDPRSFQYSFGLLRYLDGTLPPLEDYSNTNKTILLSQSEVFAKQLESLNAPSADFMGNLSIGVRGFWTQNTCAHLEESEKLWHTVYKSSPAYSDASMR